MPEFADTRPDDARALVEAFLGAPARRAAGCPRPRRAGCCCYGVPVVDGRYITGTGEAVEAAARSAATWR